MKKLIIAAIAAYVVLTAAVNIVYNHAGYTAGAEIRKHHTGIFLVEICNMIALNDEYSVNQHGEWIRNPGYLGGERYTQVYVYNPIRNNESILWDGNF